MTLDLAGGHAACIDAHDLAVELLTTALILGDQQRVEGAIAVARPVDVHAYSDRIVIRQDGVVVAEHPRAFGRGQAVYDPWRYVPVLARKPGALRNGAPFRDWALPQAIAAIRRKLKGSDDGDRQMVQILTFARNDRLQAVEAACREALAQGVQSAAVIINFLARS